MLLVNFTNTSTQRQFSRLPCGEASNVVGPPVQHVHTVLCPLNNPALIHDL